MKPKQDSKTFQFNVPYVNQLYSDARVKEKPEGRIAYDVLRGFSVTYSIARACIDYLKSKIIKLDYVFVPEDQQKKLSQDDPKVYVLKQFFKSPLGYRTKYRQLIEAVLEDYLVVGSFALERLRTRGGQFLSELKLVDSATIQVLSDEYGRLPLPPTPAFIQIINGQKKAELTQDELIYITRGYRTNSLYGLSPLESLIIQVESALKEALYTRAFFTDGSVPEGFGELPEGWTVNQIKEFQEYFNAMMAGNTIMQQGIKMVPKGFNYTAAKKPQDIGFERFEKWLLLQTCAVFGVPPQDIGDTDKVTKANGQTQQNLGEERGMRPLATMLEEVFTDIIQYDFGFTDIRFKFKDLDPIDAKLEAEVMEIKLRSGVLSVDEVRAEEGLDPIGLGHYVEGNVKLVSQLLNPPEETNDVEEEKVAPDKEEKDEEVELDEAQKADLIKWFKNSKKCLKDNKPFKKFESEYLDAWMVEEIFKQLEVAKTKDQVNAVFDPYLTKKAQTLKTLEKLTHVLNQFSTHSS